MAREPRYVRDKETGHRFPTYMTGDHLEVLDESPYDRNGRLRPAKPNLRVGARKRPATSVVEEPATKATPSTEANKEAKKS